jgi:F0F1-type ATP synthase membrane subunit c/vacuolar-type H+-ATPase subunit K
MPQLFANNARALLASGINDTATSLTIEANKADLFPTANTGTGPVPSANNWYKVTLQDAQGNTEIVYVRTRTAGSGVLSNVIRGQEGTTARSFSAGAVVGLRLTALDVQQSINVLSNNNLFTGSNTFTAGISVGAAWDIVGTAQGLIIRNGGTAVAKIESNGNITSVGTLSAGGTV